MAEMVMVTPWPLGDLMNRKQGLTEPRLIRVKVQCLVDLYPPICPRPTRSLSCGYHPSPASPGLLCRTTGILLAQFHHSLILFLPFLCVECVPSLRSYYWADTPT